MFGVLINDSGELQSEKLKKTRTNLVFKGQTLNLLHSTEEVALLSPRTVESILENGCFEFELPPPLSLYIYPKELIVLKYTNNVFSNMHCSEFEALCKKYVTVMRESMDDCAVYDVPLNIESDEEEPIEEEEHEEESEEEDEKGEEEEEEWEYDDEITDQVK